MRKIAIISGIVFCLLIAGWTYLCFASVPWISDFARSTTHSAALAAGLHVFEPAQTNAAATAPKQETVANLPDGYYIYLGQRPANTAAKWVAVNPGGSISWLDLGANQPAPSKVVPAVAISEKMPANAQFEEYTYPKIKWKAKALPGGAVVQLHTTYQRGEAGQPGIVKYRLTLFKAKNNFQHEVQLLDADGFKSHQFTASDFHQYPDSELMESRDSIPADENEYRQWRDYSVN